MDTVPAFKLPLGPIIPVISIAVSIWMVAAANPFNLIAGLVGVIVASLLYFVINKGSRPGTTPE